MQRIAVPTVNGSFSQHFGGADRFAIFEVDEKARKIVSSVSAVPPPHEQGSFPAWLKEQNVNVILAGGMGPRAVTMLEDFGIQVVTGVPGGGAPAVLVESFLGGGLAASGESCHGHGNHGCQGHKHD